MCALVQTMLVALCIMVGQDLIAWWVYVGCGSIIFARDKYTDDLINLALRDKRLTDDLIDFALRDAERNLSNHLANAITFPLRRLVLV